jgi:hypothetical protein
MIFKQPVNFSRLFVLYLWELRAANDCKTDALSENEGMSEMKPCYVDFQPSCSIKDCGIKMV